ncbi:endonuclease/exonuclease/phosphatase family protein [Oceanicella actignis]|uniref:endonuclease/exonuclease/phosphatase family protein n=1 Tax=Oceanicella actignis TaxID=1189325 RepID=UPI0011E718C6|nr:endonuclease/exonuclease/phosphatase family protein [Oceanicella actignis]TYO90544.1 endonuclease/exonuclease/phosphatase family protein [Oceanicella actignis]
MIGRRAFVAGAALAAACRLAALPAAAAAEQAGAWPPPPAAGAIRVATFNASLSRRGPGLAWKAIAQGRDPQPRAVAEIIRRVRPDILLINELDHDPEGLALRALADVLRRPADGLPGVDYPHLFSAPVNAGEPSGLDLDGDGVATGPGDAFGWGAFPGQYGMALLSRFPIDAARARSFRLLKWAQMPDSLLPVAHYGPAAPALRLSSKSHWDVPAMLPGGVELRILASHPTPPVFDGPEDRNGRRNHDEIRFWLDYLAGADWIVDDAGVAGGLPAGAAFVIMGDLNADPQDGEARRDPIRALLASPLVQDPRPASPGAAAAAAAQGGENARHRGDPAFDTADWRDKGGPGNLRVDYVLPAAGLRVAGAGVFWPAPHDPLARLVKGGRRPASSDHRLVWVDLLAPGAGASPRP